MFRSSGLPGTLVLAVLLFLAGCEYTNVSTVEHSGLQSLVMEPGSLTLANGTIGSLKAVGHFKDGTVKDLSESVTWAPSHSGVAAFEAGTVRGQTPGEIEVLASLDGLSAGTTVVVTDATLVSAQVEEPPLGTNSAYRLVGFYSDGTQQELSEHLTPGGAIGAVRAQASGYISVTWAEYYTMLGLPVSPFLPPGTISVPAFLFPNYPTTPTPPTPPTKSLSSLSINPSSISFAKGLGQSFLATGLYSDGSTQDLTNQVAWTSSNPAICAVNSQGQASGVGVGPVTISATYQGRTGTASVTVNPATLSSLSLLPGAVSLLPGATQQLRLTARYSDSLSYDVSELASFISSAPSVASVTTIGPPRGLVTGLASGSTTVKASFGGLTAETGVQVNPETTGFPLRITVDPPTIVLPKGLTQQLTVTAHYSDNTTRNVTEEASFNNLVPYVASVSTLTPRGVVTAKATGSGAIAISYAGMSATGGVIVNEAKVSTLKLLPGTASIVVGNTQQFLVRALFTDGVERDVTAHAVLNVDPTVAELTAAPGQVRGRAPGRTNVSVSFGGKQALAPLEVVAKTITRLSISPSNLILMPKDALQLRAIGYHADGSEIDVTSSARWSSQDTSVLTVGAQGLATARKLGSSAVTATLGSLTASEVVKVQRRGKGEGYFSPWCSDGSYADDLAIADFDGDGWKDAVSVYSNSSVVQIRFNSQGGFLTRPGDIALTSNWRLREVEVADLDKDGDEDIVATEVQGRRVVVLWNNGNGTFSRQTSLLVGDGRGYPLELRLSDLDTDGDVDILVQDASVTALKLLTFRNDGMGQFSAQVESQFANGSPWRHSLIDLDGSNGPDIVYVDSVANDVVAAFNAGDGTFLMPRVLLDNVNVSGVIVGDWNRDGHLDLATSHSTSDHPEVLKIWLNNGTGQFSAGPTHTGTYANVFAPPCDLDGDGNLDIVMFGGNQPLTFMLYGRGDGSFEPGRAVWGQPRDVRAADMNGDGNVDLVSSTSAGFLEHFLDNERFTPQVSHFAFDAGVSRGFASGDFDRDGDLDFVVLNDLDSVKNRVLLNDGHGLLTQSSTFRSGSNPNTILVADFNRDGKLDLATNDTVPGAPTVTVLLGLGNGTFPDRTSYRLEASGSLVAGDFDGDGDVDLASGHPAAGLRIYPNNGQGVFNTASSVHPYSGLGLTAADVDGDGDLDLVGFSNSDFRIKVSKNNGSGSFSAPTDHNTGYGDLSSLAAVDVDGDGDEDLAVCHGGDAKVTVIMRNDGTGAFVPSPAFSETAATKPAFGDIDGDGDQDLVTSFLRLNDGTGNYDPPKSSQGWGDRPRLVGDFDGDGDFDIALLTNFKQFWDCVAIWPNGEWPHSQ